MVSLLLAVFTNLNAEQLSNEIRVENNFNFRHFQIHSLKASLTKFQRVSKALASHHNGIKSSFSGKKKKKEISS